MNTQQQLDKAFQYATINFGCDPEFFFQRNGKVIGSEKVIDIKKGLEVTTYKDNLGRGQGGNGKFIVDGVQAELNPAPSFCRARLANEISGCFRTLKAQLDKDPTLSVDWSCSIKVPKKELDSLADSSKVFGCAPSKNARADIQATIKMKDISKIDTLKYRNRSAGGHIHLGRWEQNFNNAALDAPERLVPLLDILVGLPCVLMDRDPGNVERRKVYGRAGEYRTPPHGVEYRTLSNFWLRSYPLMSFVMGMARFATNVLANTLTPLTRIHDGYDPDGYSPKYKTIEPVNFEQLLLDRVNLVKVYKAINANDFDLAMEQWQGVEAFIKLLGGIAAYSNRSLVADTLPAFNYFVNTVRVKGLEHFFPDDPVSHWSNLGEGHSGGWETFMNRLKYDLETGKLKHDVNKT